MRKLNFVLFVIVLVVAGCSDNPHSNHKYFSDLPEKASFTHLPTDLSEMMAFGPMGGIFGIPKMHGGFMLQNPFTFPAEIPVYAMADGYIVQILKEFRTVPEDWPNELKGTDYDDYAIHIVYSKHVGGYLGHINALSQEILQQAGRIREGRGVRNKVEIKITAGQVLGFLGPHPGFDIGLYDHERENYFANPSWYDLNYRSAVSYTDYLPDFLKNELWTINPRTVEPRGGRVAYDVEGTISGNWFLEGAKEITEWSKQLIFARHEIHGERITIADASPLVDGDGILNDGREPYLWWVVGNMPDPESVTINSGPVKYEVITWWRMLQIENPSTEGTILVQLLNPKKLQYEWFEGKVSADVSGFTSNSRMYVR